MKKQESIKVRQHIPNFVDCGEPNVAEAKTLKELLEVQWIKDYATDGLSRFCRSDIYPKGTLLMVENKSGTKWWVVGTVKKGSIEELPRAKMKRAKIKNAST